MIFNSLAYVFFLTIVVVIYYILPEKFKWILLIIASIGYYLSFIPSFIFLLLFVVLINYFLSGWLARVTPERSGYAMFFTFLINILVLIFFKYFNSFFPDFQIHLYNTDLFYRTYPVNKLILPLGLSYFIFTLLSYQIEIKRKTIQPEKHFGFFSLYLLFFPKIAQGPIERPQKLLSQLHQSHSFDSAMIVEGLKMILWGFFKKIVVADRLALYVNAVYNNSDKHSGSSLIVATIFFAFQIYADFSGYTDIALGSAKLFGIDLTNNFKRPYLASSVKEFWNRWHITLSTWLRDYLFLPLAISLSGKITRQRFLFISTEKWVYLVASIITFGICGIWHGVGYTYLLWGILFGVYLTWANWTADINKKIRKSLHIKKSNSFYIFYNILITFILVLIAWIFFRADSVTGAFNILKKIFTAPGSLYLGSPSDFILCLFGILSLIALDLKREYFNTRWSILYNKYSFVRIAGITAIIMVILLIGVLDGGQFIYFQF